MKKIIYICVYACKNLYIWTRIYTGTCIPTCNESVSRFTSNPSLENRICGAGEAPRGVGGDRAVAPSLSPSLGHSFIDRFSTGHLVLGRVPLARLPSETPPAVGNRSQTDPRKFGSPYAGLGLEVVFRQWMGITSFQKRAHPS